MYEIILLTSYLIKGKWVDFDEVYENLGFKTIDEAVNYLSENKDEILENFPVFGIWIRYNHERKFIYQTAD